MTIAFHRPSLSILALAAVLGAEDVPPAPLPAGEYVCATQSGGALLDAQALTIERSGEQVVLVMREGHPRLGGKLVGTRLYLVRHEIDDVGLVVVHVAGELQADGSVRGSAVRTLDGRTVERGSFLLRPLAR